MEPDSQMTPHDLQNFDTAEKRLDEARVHFERAMELRQQLAQQDPEQISSISRRVIEQSWNGRSTTEPHQLSPPAFRRRPENLPSTGATEPRRRPFTTLATNLNNLGSWDPVQHQPDDARRHYEEALQDYRQLARQNPDVYLGDMATLLKQLREFRWAAEPLGRRPPRLRSSTTTLPTTCAAESSYRLAEYGHDPEQPGKSGSYPEPHRRRSSALHLER